MTDPVAELKRRILSAAIGAAAVAILYWLVVRSPDESHLASLEAMFWLQPVFMLQVGMLIAVALLMNYIVLHVRSRPWYDTNGAAMQLKTVQRRIGTEFEQPYDSVAMAIQFLASTILIATVILSFFLARSGASVM